MKTNLSDNHLPDEKALDELLEKWKPIAPSPHFNVQVWQRVSETSSPWFWLSRVRDNMRPLDTLTALAGIAAGLILSLQLLNPGVVRVDSQTQILHSANFTRGYVQMISQGVK